MTQQGRVESIRNARPIDLYKNHKCGITEEEFRRRCGGQNVWHSVDLGDVWIEGDRKTSTVLARETPLLDWPDLRGKSVLDIGAHTGFFSFEAERRGAESVTAIDYYSWASDLKKLREWLSAEQAKGNEPNAYDAPASVIDEVGTPGRKSFDVTHDLLGSKVEAVTSRLEDFDSEPFDVVLYMGVLYHVENPVLSLRKITSLTRDHLILETHGVHIPGYEHCAIWDFQHFHDDARTTDRYWVPNQQAVKDILKMVGFSRVELKSGIDSLPEAKKNAKLPVRIWAHAWK